MIRPLFWMSVGAYGALRGRRRAIEVVDRYVPRAVADRAADSLKSLAGNLSRAQSEAKQAMRSRETELREEIGRGSGHND